MVRNELNRSDPRPAGYTALLGQYNLEAVPNWHQSFVAASGGHKIDASGSIIEEVYPPGQWPGDKPGDHLEFALKYDGTNLAILASVFEAMPEKDLVEYIQSKPTGKYARRLWFLYEFLTGRLLPIEDIKQGNYVDLLEPDEYYTASLARRVRRQRVNVNLLGDRRFCPVIRRTDTLRGFEEADLPAQCRRVASTYPPELLKRALSYLYTKETKSSFELEHITPTSTRRERFVAMLRLSEQEDFCRKDRLIDLQNRTVDPRFKDSDYRSNQNYIGETVTWGQEKVHFVCPKPGDLPDLMDGLLATHARLSDSEALPVIHAAVVAFGFVFLHPFEDGNGRIHRFLIHNILARRGFTPEGLMVPVSASMLRNAADYDASLEAFSRPLMALVSYSLDEEGRMTVHNDTAVWYRYIDMTSQAEALYNFIDQAIETELAAELAFLMKYDKTKAAIQQIVDMPDRQIDLFIRFCFQNKGRLSERKRASHFDCLTDDEIQRLEQAVQAGYEATSPRSPDPRRGRPVAAGEKLR